MNTLRTVKDLKVVEKSRAIAEIGDIELTNIARDAELLKGKEMLSEELRNFALNIAEVCASIVDHYHDENRSAGDEIRTLFKIDWRHLPEKTDIPAG